jgi:hypothetical protein
MISDNFEITYGLGKLTILPAALTVKALDTLMFQGDSLPVFSSLITGLKNQDTLISGPLFSLNPSYTGDAGVYQIVPYGANLDCPECYQTTYQDGTLYVNPKGKFARKLKPYLVCVSVLKNDPSGLNYVANFQCENDNATVVYVPVGENNFLSGAGAATAQGSLPTLFYPGQSNSFQIKFNGNKITWNITTYNVNQNSAVAQDASSTSSRCKGNTGNLRTGSAQQSSFGTSGSSSNTPKDSTQLNVNGTMMNSFNSGINLFNPANNIIGIFPNPSRGSFTISSADGPVSGTDVFVSDLSGKRVSAQVSKISFKELKIDLPSSAPAGVYILRVKVGNNYSIFKLVKM